MHACTHTYTHTNSACSSVQENTNRWLIPSPNAPTHTYRANEYVHPVGDCVGHCLQDRPWGPRESDGPPGPQGEGWLSADAGHFPSPRPFHPALATDHVPRWA